MKYTVVLKVGMIWIEVVRIWTSEEAFTRPHPVVKNLRLQQNESGQSVWYIRIAPSPKRVVISVNIFKLFKTYAWNFPVTLKDSCQLSLSVRARFNAINTFFAFLFSTLPTGMSPAGNVIHIQLNSILLQIIHSKTLFIFQSANHKNEFIKLK